MSVALVIGAGGGIGEALVKALLKQERFSKVYAVSRRALPLKDDRLESQCFDTGDEEQVNTYCEQLKHQGEVLTLAVCCVGTLHDDQCSPEKKLEDVNAEQLRHYFNTNTVIPMIWISHLVSLFPSHEAAVMAVFSARVGSISDNRLGGWYGYRASKAALNMLVKTAQIEYRRRAKGTALLAYHPGTVDTNLSEPFQGSVPEGKLFTPEFTVQQLLGACSDLNAETGPFYLDWQGKTIQW